MRKILFLILLFTSSKSDSQEVIIHNPRNHSFIHHIDNPMYVLVEGYKCKSVILKTDNGKLEKAGCYFNFRPERFGIANIEISVSKNGKKVLIQKRSIQIESFPPPVATIAGLKTRSIQIKVLQAQAGISAKPDPGLGFELNYKVESFYLTIIRNDSTVFSRKNVGNDFSVDLQRAIKNLQQYDIVLVSQIKCITAEGTPVDARPLEYCLSD